MKKYIAYLKNNPQKYWFKRKVYGWGWTPATWQGFLVTFLYVGIVIFCAVSIENISSEKTPIVSILGLIFVTLIFLIIVYKKGEKPKWMWGIPKDKE